MANDNSAWNTENAIASLIILMLAHDFQAYWRYSISHIFPCCSIKAHIKILLQHNLPKRQLKKRQTFCLDCWKQSNHKWMILFHIWWNFPLVRLTDSGHIHVCSGHALSHTLHPWNSNPLNLICSVSIFLLPEWVNDNIWAACHTTQNYNLSFKGGGNGGRGYAAIVEFTWDFIVFAEQTKIKVLTLDPVFHSEVLPVWEIREFIFFFWKLIALKKDEFHSSGPPTGMASSPSKFSLELTGTLLPLYLLWGHLGAHFAFLLPPLVECHLPGIAFKWFTLWMFSVEHCVFPLRSEFNFSNWIEFYVTFKWELSSSYHPSLCLSILLHLLFIAPIYWPHF